MSGAGGPAPAAGPRVLLVRLSALGDVVLATAAARALRAVEPAAAITFCTREEYAPLLGAEPWADAVWALPAAARGGRALAPWRARVREAGFDAVVDLQTNARSTALLRGHPRRLAWRAARWQRRRWVSLRFTHPLPVRPAWLRFVDALAPLGVRPEGAEPPALALPASARAEAKAEAAAWQAALGAPRPQVFLAPGAHWGSKRWPEASYLALARDVVGAGGRVLLGGDARDRAALPSLAAWALAEPAARWCDAALPGLAARVALSAAAVANDTGLGHLAAAVGVPVVSVYGSTHPALGFPPAGPGHTVLVRGLSCQPCTLHGRPSCPLGHHRCVTEIAPAQVATALAVHLPGLAAARGATPAGAPAGPSGG